MKKIFVLLSVLFFSSTAVFASSMFDDNGNYSGNWKQMTNVSQNASSKYKSSDYYTSSWYAQQNKRKNSPNYTQTASSNKNDTVPFRYNTLNYSKYRKMHGAEGDYKTKCMDIGDASFCH